MNKDSREKIISFNQCESVSLKPRIEHQYQIACEAHSMLSTLYGQMIIEGETSFLEDLKNNPGAAKRIIGEAYSCSKTLVEYLLPMLTLVKHPEIVTVQDLKGKVLLHPKNTKYRKGAHVASIFKKLT